MGLPRPQPWVLGLLLFLLPGSLGAESHLSLLYHLTAVSSPAPGTPAFWASGWLGPQQYLSYSSLRGQAEPCGAWVWENQVSWYWEKETTDLRMKEKLFLEAFKALDGKEPPSMRLKARPGSPGFSVLTCSAFSFYPPELQLRFQRNGLAAGTGEGDFGPNGDGSFHAWSSLTVKSGDEHHYCCIVQHAGLAQPLRVELESPAKSSVLVVGIVVGVLLLTAVAVGGALLWRRMQSGLPAPWISLRGDDAGALLPTPGEAQDADWKDANSAPATA
ncbi:IgG receptor FcRn large subunit p51 isoform X3 [Callithrix jacchus]|uniref:IgG receptor FcRn large subunit p51 n=1 Tax=Callithrix jacchus TaxID=9483 RepID=F7EY50_CALJA|nr:IgG receptor FcRn large subunit p51 isoform X2 [Callithrix jacchus]